MQQYTRLAKKCQAGIFSLLCLFILFFRRRFRFHVFLGIVGRRVRGQTLLLQPIGGVSANRRIEAGKSRNTEEHSHNAEQSAAQQNGNDDPEAGEAGTLAQDRRAENIAGKLLQVFLDFAQANKLAFLTLEVRASNHTAIMLYGSRGFRSVGRRKNYYEHPKEDAIIMTREFTHAETETADA